MQAGKYMRSTAFCVAMVSLCGAARAQQETDAAATNATVERLPPVSANGDIIVTARRRSEASQSVPASIVAFDQKGLTQKAITTGYDLATVVPGLTADSGVAASTVPQFSIRGRGLNYGAAAGSVETYFADVPLSAPFLVPALPPQFFDVGSFQVLKGPQGTLFGRSTTGGAVVIVPQAPSSELGGYARVQVGTYGDVQAEGALNIPLVSDKVLLRVASFLSSRDGYMTALATTDAVTGRPLPAVKYNNVNTREVRATLLIRPSDDLSNSTIFTYHWDKQRNSTSAGLNLLGIGTPNGKGAFYDPRFGSRTSLFDVNLSRPATKVSAVINTTAYDFTSDVSIKNIFGYIHSSGYTNDGNDGDGTNITPVSINLVVPPRPRRNDQYTDEVQLQGKSFDDRLNWTVGGLVDLTREPGALDDLNFFSSLQSFGRLSTILTQNKISSYGFYASTSFKVADNFNLTGGFRHSWDNVDTLSYSAPGLALVANPAGVVRTSTRGQGNAGVLQLDYKPDENVLLYGGYRRGYKRGGANSSAVSPDKIAFGAESVDDLFVGLKSQFHLAHMPVRLNIEGYYDFYKNLQLSYYTFAGDAVAAVTVNVPKTNYRGIDIDLTFDPADWLTVSANYALIDAYHTSWRDNTVTGQKGDLTTNPVPFAVKNKFSITPRLHLGGDNDIGEFALAPTISYQSKYYTSATGSRLTNATATLVGGQINTIALGGSVVPAYTLVNLRGEWNSILGSKISAAVNVINLTNKFYILGSSGALNFGTESYLYAAPRTVSVDLSVRF